MVFITLLSIATSSLAQAAIGPATTPPLPPPPRAMLSATSTAQDNWTEELRYQWEVHQSVGANSYEIRPGTPTVARFEAQAVRTIGSRVQTHLVQGQVCITNRGNIATQQLAVWGGIQEKLGGSFKDISDVNPGNPRATEVAPGKTLCLPYRLEANLRPAGEYRHHATICHWDGATKCLETDAPLYVAANSVVTETDKQAFFTSALSCPAGLSCHYNLPPLLLTEPFQQVKIDVSLENSSRTCGTGSLSHAITIANTAMQPLATVTTETQTVCQSAPVTSQCAASSDFWNAHAGSTTSVDLVTSLLPVRLGGCGGLAQVVTTQPQAASVLSKTFCADGLANGIGALYSELLATQLNLIRGTDNSQILGILAEVDTFLVQHDCADWAALSDAERNTVHSWTQTLQRYNAGLLGAPACVLTELSSRDFSSTRTNRFQKACAR